MQDFFAQFFEMFGTVVCNATTDLYTYVYVGAGFLWLIFTAIWTLLFYQGFGVWRKRARWNTVGRWLLWMFVSAALTTLFIWIFTFAQFDQNGLDYYLVDYLEFLMVTYIWCLAAYFLYSLGFKFTNASRRKIPF